MSEDKKIIVNREIIDSKYIQDSIKIIVKCNALSRFDLHLYEPLKLYFICIPADNHCIQILCSGLPNVYEGDKEFSVLVTTIDEYLELDDRAVWPVKYIRDYQLQYVDVPELLN